MRWWPKVIFLSLLLREFSLPAWGIPLKGHIPLSPTIYNMKDLEVLEAEKNYQEFFQHALDIRPSLRQQHWKDMINNMAESYTQHILSKKILVKQTLQQIEDLFEWPILQQNDFFLRDRGRIGLLYFQKCFSKREEPPAACLKTMDKFWRQLPLDPYLGLEFAKLAKQYQNQEPQDYWSYLQKALNHDFSLFLCKDKMIKEILFQHLSIQLIKEEKNPQKILKIIDETVSKDCWKVFREELQKALYTASGQIQKNAYTLLKLKSDLTQAQKDFYLTLFILQGPVKGETFNESWNNLKELGSNFQRRMETFKQLKKVDPLPGKIFAIYNQQNKSIILDHFYKYFPEYMDYYARTCLNYLTGKTSFTNGNPTLHCKDLFQSAQNTSWVDPQLQKTYTQLKKF